MKFVNVPLGLLISRPLSMSSIQCNLLPTGQAPSHGDGDKQPVLNSLVGVLRGGGEGREEWGVARLCIECVTEVTVNGLRREIRDCWTDEQTEGRRNGLMARDAILQIMTRFDLLQVMARRNGRSFITKIRKEELPAKIRYHVRYSLKEQNS